MSKSINNLQPPIFKNWFIFCSNIHNYDTVPSSTDKLLILQLITKPSYRTDSRQTDRQTDRQIYRDTAREMLECSLLKSIIKYNVMNWYRNIKDHITSRVSINGK